MCGIGVMVFFAALHVCAATNGVPPVVSQPATNVADAAGAAISHEAPPAARPQCEATTKSGNRCSRKAAPGEKLCRQHLKSRRRNAK